MALFKKKKEEVAVEKEVATKEVKKDSKKEAQRTKSTSATSSFFKKGSEHVLKAPRITEKATIVSEKGVYVFNVDPRSTKQEIAKSFEEKYKVKPVKVNTVKVPSKKVRTKLRGVFGKKAGGKKAYVYLKKGDTIEVV
jgi:large subunit ribosomal protein L23